MIAILAISKIGQPIKPILLQCFALFWSYIPQKSVVGFQFLKFFEIQESNKYEKYCQMLKTFLGYSFTE